MLLRLTLRLWMFLQRAVDVICSLAFISVFDMPLTVSCTLSSPISSPLLPALDLSACGGEEYSQPSVLSVRFPEKYFLPSVT